MGELSDPPILNYLSKRSTEQLHRLYASPGSTLCIFRLLPSLCQQFFLKAIWFSEISERLNSKQKIFILNLLNVNHIIGSHYCSICWVCQAKYCIWYKQNFSLHNSFICSSWVSEEYQSAVAAHLELLRALRIVELFSKSIIINVHFKYFFLIFIF